MMSLSVLLLLFVTIGVTQCRRLNDDIDNDISSNPQDNIGFRNQKSVWVKISQGPTQMITKKVGQHVELTCEAMGSPPPTIQWYKRNTRITENDSFESSLVAFGSQALAKVSSRLVISYILPRHQDIYRCVASTEGAHEVSAASKLMVSNKEGNEMNFTQLVARKILGAHHLPRVTFWAPTYMDVIGNDVILPCTSVGNPKPTLTWLDPNGKPIQDDERHTIFPNGELRIRSIAWEDMGVFTCSVQNLIGEDSVDSFLYPMQDSK